MNNNLRLLIIIRCIRHANSTAEPKNLPDLKTPAIPAKAEAAAIPTTPLLSNGIMTMSVGMWIAMKITTEISMRH
jgi:hypothetical protein